MADSIIAKVTSYNDSVLSMLIKEYHQRNSSEWRTGRHEIINFDKRTKTRFYKNLEDSISMWYKPREYEDEDYSISDYLFNPLDELE